MQIFPGVGGGMANIVLRLPAGRLDELSFDSSKPTPGPLKRLSSMAALFTLKGIESSD